METAQLTPEALNAITCEELSGLFESSADFHERATERDGEGSGRARFDEEHAEWLRDVSGGALALLLNHGSMEAVVYGAMCLGYAIAHLELGRERAEVEELTR